MPKPSQMTCDIPECPYDGVSAKGEWYKPQDHAILDRLELAINHGIDGQMKHSSKGQQAIGRNHFHYTGEYRKLRPGEQIWSWRANPLSPPDWNELRKRFENNGRQTRL